MIAPWYSGRMPAGEITLARVLQGAGYTTGHSRKWHMAINHKAFPQPEDQGFDWTRSDRGEARKMKPDRLTGFATSAPDDPFFLYLATWLVHTPIHSRDRALLEKYCTKLGIPFPTSPEGQELAGQQNPYYCAMVELLDYYTGTVITHLETTDDPRWPGHKLSENTYVIITSDNGGMEKHPGEIITDNAPLDRGKISAKEGGTRVPLIITGPGITAGVQSDVMVNGLDFYPTVLSLCGIDRPAGKPLDGSDLAPLLLGDTTAPSLVKHADGTRVRDSMVWHFPNSNALESTIRIGDYKLIRNYDHINNPSTPAELELFQLYDTRDDGTQHRVDIEEAQSLATAMPEKTAAMNAALTLALEEMKASYPYYNPSYTQKLPGKDTAPQSSPSKSPLHHQWRRPLRRMVPPPRHPRKKLHRHRHLTRRHHPLLHQHHR